ncbi:MAG TPA: sugar ABC transporter substrate-binding protein [Streptosporangiaceae bacterium]|nr:sugar ABC transporter substrate-binding protein [Streptosporangiaceae bacterium]
MNQPRALSRRQFLAASGLAAGALGVAACGGSSAPKSKKSGPATVTFTTWAGAAEATAFKQIVTAFEAANKSIKVNLDIVPYAEMFQGIDAKLQAGDAPDMFRVTYTNLGIYSSKNVLLDMTPYVDSAFISQFQPAYWSAISFKGKPYGVPHQTDTTMLLYNKDMLDAAGVTSVPDTLASTWTWEEFLAVAKKVQAKLPAGHYAFMYDWAQTGAFRWLSWLFEAGGNLLNADLKTPAINSPAGLKAIEFTQSFFTEQLVPKNTSTGNATYPDSLFPAKTIAMAFAADFLLPGDIASAAKFPYAATFQPRDVTVSSDLGGNGIVGTNQSKNPEAAAEFLKFLVSRQSQQTFCEQACELPTRKDLVDATLNWTVRPDLMKMFVQQATVLTPFQVEQVTIPAFGSINTALQNQLDAAFVGGQSASTTAANISSAVSSATAASA